MKIGRKLRTALAGAVMLTTLMAAPSSILAEDYEQEMAQAMSVSSAPGGINISQLTGGLDLESYMMMVQAERARLLEAQMSEQIAEVRARQQEIAELNAQLASLDHDSEEAKEIKARLDAMVSTSQIDMLRLQSLTNKRNEAFEILTNALRKMSESREAIIRNMR